MLSVHFTQHKRFVKVDSTQDACNDPSLKSVNKTKPEGVL